MGDFSCVRYGHEKTRENRLSPSAIEDGNKCIQMVELHELKWWGSKFTWWNQ